MKQFLFFIFMLALSSKSFGQGDFNTKFKPIPPINAKEKPKKEAVPPPTDVPKIVAPNVFRETNIFGTKVQENNSFQIGAPENKISMIPKNNFEHKIGDVYRDKMNQDLHKTLHEGDGPLDRADRFLGDFKTKSKFLVVKYRDYIYIDGDLISVYLNDNLIQSRLFLNAQLGEFIIPLSVGINNIEFVVASQGTSGGNTAEIHVLDDENKKITVEFWDNLALGTKVKLIVIKE